MSSSMPTRVDGDLFEVAKSIGAEESRSAAQQITHWARIGRELEASPRVNHRDIRRVLAGVAAYDDLDEHGQAVVRATWDEQVVERRARLDLAAEFRAAGRTWTEADSAGRAVTRGRDSDS
ncbi:TA system antitoxin ParD family protein [Microbacterium sp. 179-I 3D3 NHS]|uniref:TA system antitoxin ParD family protein n=1 Tax=unclassified Microbacterium TaxID=2609290 RepID=UPI00399FAF62